MNAHAIHTCSYQCERPECIRAQRDELAAKQGFTAADMADQGARQFDAGYAAAKAELHAAAQEAVAEVIVDAIGYRYLSWSAEWFAGHEELPPVGTKLYAAPAPAAPGIDRADLIRIIEWWNAYAGPVDDALGEIVRRLRALIDTSPKGGSHA